MEPFSYLGTDIRHAPYFIFAFLRIVTVLFFLPIFSEPMVPARLRIFFGLGFALVLWPIIEDKFVGDASLSFSMLGFLLLTLRELFVAFCIGFSAKFLIYALAIFSQIVGVNMGFQAGQMFNPSLGEQTSAFGQFMNLIVLVVLVIMNVHHVFLEVIFDSFRTINLSYLLPIKGGLAQSMIHLVTDCFLLGIKLAAPLLCVQILVTVSLGLVNRAIPQMSVFVMNFPLSFLITMMVMILGTSTFLYVITTTGIHQEIGWLHSIKRLFRG